MDFLSLSSEYETYQEYYTKTKNTMFSVSNFFINYHKSLNEYATNIENSLNELLSNFISYDKNISHVKKFFSFFQLFERHLLNLTSISKKVLTEIISPTTEFTSFLFSENKRNLEKLNKIIINTNIQKQKYDKQKEIYFESCKLAEKQEKKLVEEMNRHGNNSEQVKNKNDILTKLRIQSQEQYQKYKEEHQKTNELYNDNNTKYFKIINHLKDNEEKRINYLSFHVEKFVSILTEERNSLSKVIESSINKEEVNDLQKSLRSQLDDDMKAYKDKFNFVYKPDQRFLEEELLMYDVYRRKMEGIMAKNNLLIKHMFNRKDLFISYLPTNIINNNLNITRDMEEYFSKFNNISLEQNDLIVYKNIFDKNPLNVNIKLFENFKAKLRTDSKFAQKIIDKTYSDYFRNPVIFYEFKNMEQFNRLSQILINVCMNKDIFSKIFDVNFGIINIAEKGFIIEPDSKRRKYLCQVLSQNCELYHNKNHWKNLFINKIEGILNNLLKKSINNDIKIIKKDKKGKDKEDENKKIIEKKMKEIREKNCFNIFKEFVEHFPNFNLDITISNDLIINVGNTYGLSQKEINYLVCYINSNIYSIKAGYHKNNIKIKNINKSFNRNISKNYNSNYLLKNINNTNQVRLKKLYIILNSVFNYLYPKDYINLRRANKFFYQNSEKKIYKNIFLKSDKSPLSLNLFSVQKHTGMWYHFLQYDKNSINYKKIITEINQNLALKKEYRFEETIQLDVVRTFFEEDQEKKRSMVKNILLSLSEIYPKIGYCQGMNHICQFLLEITGNDETESFNIFSAIIAKTKYAEIVINDFKLMKKYFYVFDRLISIYLPDLYVINKQNNIGACFYISPWFITLFTMRFQKNQNKLILRIFDMFILDGWDCIVRIGLVMLKYYQNDLIKMKYEELLQFLINELKDKYDFFGNYNYDKFMEMYREMKIPKGLIDNIENEYKLKQIMENS